MWTGNLLSSEKWHQPTKAMFQVSSISHVKSNGESMIPSTSESETWQNAIFTLTLVHVGPYPKNSHIRCCLRSMTSKTTITPQITVLSSRLSKPNGESMINDRFPLLKTLALVHVGPYTKNSLIRCCLRGMTSKTKTTPQTNNNPYFFLFFLFSDNSSRIHFSFWENYPKWWAGQNNYQKGWYLLIILGEDFNKLNIPKLPFN